MGLGAHAAAALELSLNEMGAIFIEVAGRAATIRGFEGRQDNNFLYYNGTSDIIRVEGTLYATEADNQNQAGSPGRRDPGAGIVPESRLQPDGRGRPFRVQNPVLGKMAMRNASRPALAALLALGLALPVQGAGTAGTAEAAAQSWEWTFRVTADPAPVRAAPDPAAPQIETLAKGAQVKSFAAEGAWIRVILARRDGSVVIGYASVNDVELVDAAMNESAIYWTSLADGYRGARLALRFSAGLGTGGGAMWCAAPGTSSGS